MNFKAVTLIAELRAMPNPEQGGNEPSQTPQLFSSVTQASPSSDPLYWCSTADILSLIASSSAAILPGANGLCRRRSTQPRIFPNPSFYSTMRRWLPLYLIIMGPFILFQGAPGMVGISWRNSRSCYNIVVQPRSHNQGRGPSSASLSFTFSPHFTIGTSQAIWSLLPLPTIKSSTGTKWDKPETVVLPMTYVVDFFVNAFPDIFMIPNNSSADGAEPREVGKKIPVAWDLVQTWSHTVSTVGLQNIHSRLNLYYRFLTLRRFPRQSCFYGTSARAWARCVWYGQEVCNSSKLGGIEKEAVCWKRALGWNIVWRVYHRNR